MSTPKRCRTCREDLPLDYAHYGLLTASPDGWSPDCRLCAAAKQRARRKPKSPEKRALHNAQRRAERRLSELSDLRALEALWTTAVAREPPEDRALHAAFVEAAMLSQGRGRTNLPDRIATLERELAALPESAVLAAKESRRHIAANAELARRARAAPQPAGDKKRRLPNSILEGLADWQPRVDSNQ